MKKDIFISHSSKNDEFVKELREKLEALGCKVWADSRQLAGGDALEPEIEKAISEADAFILVLSRETFNSAWVLKETRYALEIKKERGDTYRVIPLLLPGVETGALRLYFQDEPVGIKVEIGPGGISEALPQILAALKNQLPDDVSPAVDIQENPPHELVLELTYPSITDTGGKRRAKAAARLTYYPAESGKREVESAERFTFTAPLGHIENDELSWYLERFHQWPVGVFKQRAEKVETQLPQWGQQLYKAVFPGDAVRNLLGDWEKTGDKTARRFTVYVDPALVRESKKKKQAQANEAAAMLLALPWELLHDGRTYLFQGAKPVQVRRRLPNRESFDRVVTQPPVRILLVSPRPEDDTAGYIDHRASALPLVTALESLGESVELTVLAPPTFPAMQQELEQARKKGCPYHVVHFDGHGVFSKRTGLGGLCFEDPQDMEKLEKRKSQLVDAQKIAEVFRQHRVPLVFLEACQSAKAEQDPTASVAAKLLDEGVAAVVAMSHSVLVETAKRYVGSFYKEIAGGSRVGEAMLAGHNALYTDTYRGKVFGAGRLEMQDWFVPVLYQEKEDVRLLKRLLSRPAAEIQKKILENRYGLLPKTPEHEFVGRSRELLKLERLLANREYAVVCGQGGEGKTTLAVELARWLTRTGRFSRVVFVSLEDVYDVRTVVDRIGRQLLNDYLVSKYKTEELLTTAMQPIERELKNFRTVVVLDNMESILPSKNQTETTSEQEQNKSFCGGQGGGFLEKSPLVGDAGLLSTLSKSAPLTLLDPEELKIFFRFCQLLLKTGETRLVFTSREALPEPFAGKLNRVVLGRLEKGEAVELVQRAMTVAGLTPKDDDRGGTQPEVEALVEAVNCHARSLVLLAPYIGEFGVGHTMEKLGQLMAELDKKYPNERERSLFASVELSLRRLSPAVRAKIPGLGVFQGGGHLYTISKVLELTDEEGELLVNELVQTGLAELMEYNFFRFDPALCPYLQQEMDANTHAEGTARWFENMLQWSYFLNGQLFEDAQLAIILTLLELPNLMALLDHVRAQGNAETTVNLASSLEKLIAPLGIPHLLTRIAAVREEETKKLQGAGWTHTRFVSVQLQIERLLQKGNFPQALQEAQSLLGKCRQAGEQAYAEAPYDTAVAYILLGRVLKEGGASQAALPCIDDAYNRFQHLADQGNAGTACMAAVCLAEKGDCFLLLGRYEEAAAAYEEEIQINEKRERFRDVAVGKGQLGTVRMFQRRYKEALYAYAEAIKIFTALNEPASVATLFYQTGRVHEETGLWEAAEQAYRQALTIRVQQHIPGGEADSLNQLGLLYAAMGRLEEAVVFYRQATDKYMEIKDMAKEGMARSNLANTLIKLKRIDEARAEILRAIECRKDYGHAAQLWASFAILCNIELAEGHFEAAQAAREQAIQLFLAYRRDGGENYSGTGRLCHEFLKALKENRAAEMAPVLEAFLNRYGTDPVARVLISKLQALLAGSRDPALAADPELSYDMAAEILFLIEELERV